MSASDVDVLAATGYSLRGKVIAITGAVGGMGQTHVDVCLQLGARVVMIDRVAPDGEQRPSTRFVQGDVSSESDWQNAMHVVEREFGRLDGLVNNAGILMAKSMESTTSGDYDQVVAVNQKGVFLGMRAALPLLRAAGSSSIVNISSIGGSVGISECFAYSASKFAVRGMTKAAAVELASEGIRVNSVHPGDTYTPMIEGLDASSSVPDLSKYPLGRYAQPYEISRTVAFLLCDAASFITGAEFAVDGGYTAV